MASHLFRQLNFDSESSTNANLGEVIYADRTTECSQYITAGDYVDENMKALFTAVGAISIIACMFVTISIFTVPKLRAHPNIMIGWISLFEGIS